ncbi:MAG TPA: hypothetical protein VNA22_08070 [Pyrinomonadaceae bacterium]|nr:hypothetical protein [Pyrinomonadaceae bacterium]
MSLDAGNIGQAVGLSYELEVLPTQRAVYAKWEDWPASRIDHHMRACCEFAREWIINTDFSNLNGADILTGPRWLRHRFEWGPGTYPIYWCELSSKRKLDCGVLSALAYEVFVARGVRSFRAQLVQEFSADAAAQWRSGWEGENAITEWIQAPLIYHEGVAVLTSGSNIKLWDSSAGWWIDPRSTSGYGSVRALRVTGPADAEFQWGEHTIPGAMWSAMT